MFITAAVRSVLKVRVPLVMLVGLLVGLTGCNPGIHKIPGTDLNVTSLRSRSNAKVVYPTEVDTQVNRYTHWYSGKPYNPREYKLFTREDFQQGRAALDASTVVTLRNGKTLPIDDYLYQLNLLEQQFQALGYSLREKQDKPVVIQRTILKRKKPQPGVEGRALAMTGYLEQFKPLDLPEKGWDSEIVGVTLKKELNAANGADTVATTAGTALHVNLLGVDFMPMSVSASATIPVLNPRKAVDPMRSAVVTARFMGKELGWPTLTGTSAGQLSINKGKESAPEPFESPAAEFWAAVGPVPIHVMTGLRMVPSFEKASSMADLNMGSTEVWPSMAVVLWAKASAVDVVVASAGVGGELTVVKYAPRLTSDLMLQDRNAVTDVVWNYGQGQQLDLFQGDMYLYAEVDLWLLGTRSYRWVFVREDGTSLSAAYSKDSQKVSRPPVCPGDKVGNVCGDQCVDLSKDPHHCKNCGTDCVAQQGENALCTKNGCACTATCNGQPKGASDGCKGTCDCGPRIVYQHGFTDEAFLGVSTDRTLPAGNTSCGAGFTRYECSAVKTNNTPADHSHCEAEWVSNDPGDCGCKAHFGAKGRATLECLVTVKKIADKCCGRVGEPCCGTTCRDGAACQDGRCAKQSSDAVCQDGIVRTLPCPGNKVKKDVCEAGHWMPLAGCGGQPY